MTKMFVPEIIATLLTKCAFIVTVCLDMYVTTVYGVMEMTVVWMALVLCTLTLQENIVLPITAMRSLTVVTDVRHMNSAMTKIPAPTICASAQDSVETKLSLGTSPVTTVYGAMG
jgi:hypothetical protein